MSTIASISGDRSATCTSIRLTVSALARASRATSADVFDGTGTPHSVKYDSP